VLFGGATGPPTANKQITTAAVILDTMADPSPTGGGTELGRFLRARRAQISPADVGLPVYQGIRRTPGLRREELATLAGISNDYYTRLERGKETHPSPEVIDALARALQLENDERDHLRSLAALAARRASTPPPPPSRTVPAGMAILLDSLRPCPAHVVGRNGDLLAWNPGGLQLLAGIADWPAAQRNVWRYTFLHPAARILFDDWEGQLRGCVTHLRALSSLEPDAPDVAMIVGELVMKVLSLPDSGTATTSARTTEGASRSTTPMSATSTSVTRACR
jgi:transcriptional regulator with XRE-family HTH domain